MTEFNIEEGSVPEKVNTRAKRPNPFADRFPTAEGKAMVVTLPSGTTELDKEVKAVRSLAQQAARDAGYTGRVKAEPVTVGTGKNAKPHTKLTIWSVPKITHNRKPKTDTPATPDASADSK